MGVEGEDNAASRVTRASSEGWRYPLLLLGAAPLLNSHFQHISVVVIRAGLEAPLGKLPNPASKFGRSAGLALFGPPRNPLIMHSISGRTAKAS